VTIELIAERHDPTRKLSLAIGMHTLYLHKHADTQEETRESHIVLWHACWRNGAMKSQRKFTVHIPEELLRRALDSSGKGLPATVRQGLELVAASWAYRQLRQMRDKVRISIDLRALRKDT
jgi:hypothetical protein